MAATQTNVPYRRVIEYRCLAEWRSVDVRPSQNPAAKPFGPDFELEPGDLIPERGYRSPKEVLYVPVKRQKGQETFPSVGLYLVLHEANGVQNVTVTAHRGAKVKFKVSNRWRGKKAGPVELEGTLDDQGGCFVTVPSSTVKDWLDPKKPLAGRVNEVLLDFTFEIPSLKIEGQTVKGQSVNRLFLYRRKVIVFLPGVFGSEVLVKLPDGRVVGFPDKYAEPTNLAEHLEIVLSPGRAIGRQVWTFLNHQLGGLECDAAGQPLLQPIKPMILSLFGVVYDVFDNCRAARMKYFEGVPKQFHLVEMRIFAYDWRCDLTEAAKALAKGLADLQLELRRLPDVDDEVGVAGHSTGGVIIRRALKEAGMQSLVSHAFFLNVPFRGAPKAMGVILTGKDPPGGGPLNRMIPFVDADSLRALAMGMPIVYHLAPSEKYPDRVAFTPGRPPSAARSVEDDKRDLIATAIQSGFLAPPRFVKASTLSDKDRALLAATADRWHEYWAEAFERYRAQDVYEAVYPNGYPKRDEWFGKELRSRNLEAQFDSRFVGSWNEELAGRAHRFHQESEEEAATGAWAQKAFIFYSVAKHPTMLSVHFEKMGQTDYDGLIPLLNAEGMGFLRFADGDVAPPRSEEEQTLPDGRTIPAPVVHQWTVHGKHYRRTIWRMHGVNGVHMGDGTVPTVSLLGFGGAAKVILPIPDAPDHTHAPLNAYVWERMMEILQGTLEKQYLDSAADTTRGVPGPG